MQHFRKLASTRLWRLIIVASVLSIAGCGGDSAHRFERRTSSQTGVEFANTLVEDDSVLNAIDYDYLYNGGGVAAGDLNGNGRPDLYFAGNDVQNRLYLNDGDYTFRDVTEEADVGNEEAWSTGVVLVDINQDGLLDIYVCVGGPRELYGDWSNRLYVNQGVDDEGIPLFAEKAEEYGIADSRYSTHAAFFDYDRDGNLDLYVLNNEVQARGRASIRPRRMDGKAPSTDRLYRNEGNGTFTNVSDDAGIRIEGHGLGIVVSDMNKDGWPDIYVANDFISNDVLYVNNGDGTFTNRIDEYVKHQSYSSMGVDAADVNNDAWTDILVLDMLPFRRVRDKMMSRFFDQSSFEDAMQMGYEPQYVRNVLQVSNGPTPDGGLSFSEIGQLAGIDATDWSWAPLLVDLDNDGHRDVFVTNGYGKDVTNLDFAGKYRDMMAFGTESANVKKRSNLLNELSRVRLPNFIFENDGDLAFTNRTGEWVEPRRGISTGAAVADLDGDGDLDLITNNINAEATLLENHVNDRDSSNALRVKLHGAPGNRRALGTKLTLYHESATQYHEHSPYRGYQSTVQSVAHFGLGADSTADSLQIVWPDGTMQRRVDIVANQVIEVQYNSSAQSTEDRATGDHSNPEDSLSFCEVSDEVGLTYRHENRDSREFERTPILPHRLSKEGPGLAVGDVDNNGLDDLFVGADRGENAVLFLQQRPGEFSRRSFSMGASHEDRGALFFDADGDGDLDLYVVSGGNAVPSGKGAYQDRLYVNEGDGTFRRGDGTLPEMQASGSVVTAADYDQDGDLDLFVGGRVSPSEYPLPPRSYLLRNDSHQGTAAFTDVTEEIAPDLVNPGLVTDALWTDSNHDGRVDLMVVGEWMPITVYENGKDGFREVTESVGLADTHGWWLSLAAGDFDRDGDTDYVAGSLGLNSRYEASQEEPMEIVAKDFDQNGVLDPVLTHYVDGTRYPVARRDEMIEQIPGLKARFPTYQEYAEAPFEHVFHEEELEGAYHAKAVRFETSYLENVEGGSLRVRSLPRTIQTAPIFGMESGDYDGRGTLDLLMVGNWYGPNLRTGRLAAFTGAHLQGDDTGAFSVEDGTESGFFVDGDAKAAARVETGEGSSLVVVTQNDGPVAVFRPRRREPKSAIEVRPLDVKADIRYRDGGTRRKEFYYGSGYLSQSSRTLRISTRVDEVVIYDAQGNRRTVSVDGTR